MKPKLPDTRLTVRFTYQERKVLEVQAGDMPISTYVRETVLEKAKATRKKRKTAPVKDHIALAQILALLGGHNLIQHFKRTDRDIKNGIVSVDPDTQNKIHACHALLSKIHDLLMQGLGVDKQ